jgi:hypothetical protein
MIMMIKIIEVVTVYQRGLFGEVFADMGLLHQLSLKNAEQLGLEKDWDDRQ